MDEAEYGLLNLFMLYTGILAQIYNLGVSQSFTFIYWDVYKDKEELKKLISSTLGLLIVFQIVFILLGLFFGENLLGLFVKSNDKFTFNPFFITALFFSAFMVYYEMFLYYFRNQGNLKAFSILSISTLFLLTIGTLIGVVWLDLKAVGAVFGRTAGYGIVVLFLLIFMIYKYGISFNFKKSKMMLVFGLPLFVNSIIGAFSYGLDKILIERFDTLENLGIYGFALVIVSVIEIWFNSLNNALSPNLYKYLNESLNEKIKEVQSLAHLIIFAVMIVVVMIIAFLYPLIEFIIPANFHKAALFIPVLATGFFWRVFSSLETYSLYKEKKTKYFIYNQSTTLIGLVILGYFAYQLYGILGIVYAVYFSKLIEYLIIRYIIKVKSQRLPFKLDKFILTAIILSLSAFVCTYFNDGSVNKYLLYVLPLLTFMVLLPTLLKNEFKNVLHNIKHRKELFNV